MNPVIQSMPGKNRGYTLIELMVALIISSMLIAGITQITMGSRTTYRAVENLSRMQENGRFAMDNLAHDLRMAGYLGCFNDIDEAQNFLDSSEELYTFDKAVKGYDNIPSNPPAEVDSLELQHTPLEGSDVVKISGAFSPPARVTTENVTAANKTVIRNPTRDIANGCPDGSNQVGGFCEGDILMIADCEKGAIFQSTNVTATGGGGLIKIIHSRSGSTPGNTKASWGGNGKCKEQRQNPPVPRSECFDDTAEIVKMETRIYYVAIPDGGDSPNLYLKRNNYPVDAMIADNVEDFQLWYGIDNSTGTGREIQEYLEASDINDTDWNSVVGVRAHLLTRSGEDSLAPERALPFRFVGVNNTVDDRRLRREFTTVVTLRNRALE